MARQALALAQAEGAIMGPYAQMVKDAAKSSTEDLSDVHRAAARSLAAYFLFTRGWPPEVPAFRDERVRQRWLDAMRTTLSQLVAQAWSDSSRREHIRQLAALDRLSVERYPEYKPFREYLAFHAAIAYELGTWPMWPQLHDLRVLFPIPGAVQPYGAYQPQLGQTMAFNQMMAAQMQSFQMKQAADIAAANWTNNYWQNRYWENRYWNIR